VRARSDDDIFSNFFIFTTCGQHVFDCYSMVTTW